MIDTIKFEEEKYPKFQSEGNAAQFAIPYALHVCKGKGVDIGCSKLEWAFPGARPIDLAFEDDFDAYNLPYEDGSLDYIFSSHCLEHLPNWVDALDYWGSKLKNKGTLFLYLPHYSQKYWRQWNNRKHVYTFLGNEIKDYLVSSNYTNIFVSQPDLNNSIMIMAEKKRVGYAAAPIDQDE